MNHLQLSSDRWVDSRVAEGSSPITICWQIVSPVVDSSIQNWQDSRLNGSQNSVISCCWEAQKYTHKMKATGWHSRGSWKWASARTWPRQLRVSKLRQILLPDRFRENSDENGTKKLWCEMKWYWIDSSAQRIAFNDSDRISDTTHKCSFHEILPNLRWQSEVKMTVFYLTNRNSTFVFLRNKFSGKIESAARVVTSVSVSLPEIEDNLQRIGGNIEESIVKNAALTLGWFWSWDNQYSNFNGIENICCISYGIRISGCNDLYGDSLILNWVSLGLLLLLMFTHAVIYVDALLMSDSDDSLLFSFIARTIIPR
jgi:hypothetical protein